jgi:primary-amine oxidase
MNQDAASKNKGNGSVKDDKRHHPLGPLTGAEIIQASNLVKNCWGKTALQFKVITLQEPVKTELIPYLAAERAGEPTPHIDRRAFVVYYLRGTVRPVLP